MQTDRKTCADCGLSKVCSEFGVNRSISDGLHYYCRACVARRSKAWRHANPEKVREAKRRAGKRRTTEARRAERQRALARDPDLRKREYERQVAKYGREALNDYLRRWAANNHDTLLARKREWRLANPAKQTEYARRYRYTTPGYRTLRKGDVDPAAAAYVEVIVRDPCCYCGHAGGTVDHIVPVTAGGPNAWDNYTGACLACNGGKRDRPLLTYLLMRKRAAS